MTIVVLLVLAGVWAAVLVPPLLRSRAEARPGDSIGNFRRQLHVLQRTGPVPTRMAVGDRAPSPASPLPAMAMPMPSGRPLPVVSAQAARRARTLKRRRDVLAVLLAGMTGTLVLGLLPSLRALLGLHLVLDLVCVGYVALLVQARNATAEREMKLRFLPTAAQADNIIMLRRSAN